MPNETNAKELESNHIPQLRHIDFDKGEFMANGRRYIIQTGFSIDRYMMKEEIEYEIGFGTTYREMMAAWEECYQLANVSRFADLAVLAYNKIKGIEKFSERQHAILKLCALFCNRENENVGIITEDMITEKITDWKAEGIDMADFFRLALHTMPSFIESYRKSTGIFSGNEPKS